MAAAIPKISIFNQKASKKCFDTVGEMPGGHPTHLQKTHITYTQRLSSVIIMHQKHSGLEMERVYSQRKR